MNTLYFVNWRILTARYCRPVEGKGEVNDGGVVKAQARGDGAVFLRAAVGECGRGRDLMSGVVAAVACTSHCKGPCVLDKTGREVAHH